jgi:hypothetical protein
MWSNQNEKHILYQILHAIALLKMTNHIAKYFGRIYNYKPK